MIKVDEDGLIYFKCRKCKCENGETVDSQTDGMESSITLECENCGKEETKWY